MGDPAPPPLKGHNPQFLAHVRCGQTAGSTKISLATEVGLGPGDFVLDGDSSPPRKKGIAPTQFSAHVSCGQTAGWIKMLRGTEVGLDPGHIVLPSPPVTQLSAPQKGAQLPPNFRPMSIVVKGLYGSRCHLVCRYASAHVILF